MSSVIIHERDQSDNDLEPNPKRVKLDGQTFRLEAETILPPSHALLEISLPVAAPGQPIYFTEADVGISEYVSREISNVEAIIKQRFTDFLVYEVDLDGNVVHLKDIGKPTTSENSTDVNMSIPADDPAEAENLDEAESNVQEPWPEHFTASLSTILSPKKTSELKKFYLDGLESTMIDLPQSFGKASRGHQRKTVEGTQQDNGEISSDPIPSKQVRTMLHQTIRRLFKGKLDSETEKTSTVGDGGTRVIIRWMRKGHRKEGRGTPRGTYPPYIHFTLQKTNRDTQDALGYLSRLLHVNVKDLSVAGTKDKRGITVQRVSFKRGNKTVDDVWRAVNGINPRRPAEVALKQRGERGIRIADLNYRKASLELGMLKGNSFVITLRNVKAQSIEALEHAMNSMRTKGFINYYGMQRFGTASVPTHVIGLALLKSEWHKAVSLILSVRPGEHPEITTAREAWLKDGDLDRALELMPRRVVAERCILESLKKQKGDTRNAMGVLSTIPKNLRLMYVHAYQSYIWNAIVSQRIRTYGVDKPVVGDLVLQSESGTQDLEGSNGTDEEVEMDPAQSSQRKSRKPWNPPRVKTLTEEDLERYSIFDVVMPLPGTDVAYPGGELGEKYRDFLRMDGLNPDDFVRKQKEYTLRGSYRKILHLPREVSWSVMQYTDPDVALAQADEDKLLDFDAPLMDENGKFTALQVRLTLGTAAYATMALREITKADTSSHHQTALTNASEDQQYRSNF